MPHYKNTPITNLTELVIDGRTKQIQWIKLTDELWFKSNFKEFSASSLKRCISDLSNPSIQVVGTEELIKRCTTHQNIIQLTKFYDQNPRKYDTWISGGTFNVRVKRKSTKRSTDLKLKRNEVTYNESAIALPRECMIKGATKSGRVRSFTPHYDTKGNSK